MRHIWAISLGSPMRKRAGNSKKSLRCVSLADHYERRQIILRLVLRVVWNLEDAVNMALFDVMNPDIREIIVEPGDPANFFAMGPPSIFGERVYRWQEDANGGLRFVLARGFVLNYLDVGRDTVAEATVLNVVKSGKEQFTSELGVLELVGAPGHASASGVTRLGEGWGRAGGGGLRGRVDRGSGGVCLGHVKWFEEM